MIEKFASILWMSTCQHSAAVLCDSYKCDRDSYFERMFKSHSTIDTNMYLNLVLFVKNM